MGRSRDDSNRGRRDRNERGLKPIPWTIIRPLSMTKEPAGKTRLAPMFVGPRLTIKTKRTGGSTIPWSMFPLFLTNMAKIRFNGLNGFDGH